MACTERDPTDSSKRRCLWAGAVLTFVTLSAFAAPDRVFRSDFEPPISAPAEQWTWVPFDDAFCGDGSTVGIGVNLTARSDRLLIYLQGGGACWDLFTCATPGIAVNFQDGYGPSKFAGDSTNASTLAKPGGFFDRTAAANPLKDYNYAFVPYCTGDVHSGDKVVAYAPGVIGHHVGFRNMARFLARLADTIPRPGRIVLVGSSGGGLGATLNWLQTQEAFPGIHVDMINDSGAILPESALPDPNTEEQLQRTNWNLAATLPAACSGCAASFDAIFAFYASEFPGNRGALLSFEQDTVLPLFYGISTSAFTAGLTTVETQQFDSSASLRYFNIAASGHVLWFSPGLAPGSTTLQQFVTQMVTDDPNWVSQKESN